MSKIGFISIVGKPNVGKSSILNRLIGVKLAIVTNKPETTRTRIMGVLTEDNGVQLVFTDTPGFLKPKNKLEESMRRNVSDSLEGAEGILFVVESIDKDFNGAELALLEQFKKYKSKVILAINKTDIIKDKELIFNKILKSKDNYNFSAVIPISAQSGENFNVLLDEMNKLAVEGEHFFSDDTLTDQPERVIVSEMIREQLLKNIQKEIPHGTAVSIEKMSDRGGILDIDALIYCEKISHKGIIIGKNGLMMKKIGSAARFSIEHFFGCKVNLHLYVKVKENWRNLDSFIHNFGLN